MNRKVILTGLVALIASPNFFAQTQYLIDLDSTKDTGATANGSIATANGWTSLDATNGNDSSGVTLDGITFSIGSADGSRVREADGAVTPNALTGDFAFDDGPGQAIVLFIGGAGSLPEGEWQAEVWMWDEQGTFDEMIVGYRTNSAETIVGRDFTPDPDNPAATFTFVSDGTSAYDIFVRENNSQDRARLNAVRLTRLGARGVELDRSGVSSSAVDSELVGHLVPDVDTNFPPYSFTLIAGEGDTNNSDFEIVEEELWTSASYPGYGVGQILNIRVLVEDGAGGALEAVLELLVVNDSDGDGLSDDWELMFFDNLAVATAFGNNDDDLLDNISEFQLGTFPNDGDSDDDNLQDDVEDGDGVFNGQSDPGTDPLKADTDEDNVNDGDELIDGTNPLLADSDGDELIDGDEKDAGTNPLLGDTDGDGRPDGEEIDNGSDPLDANDPSVGEFLAAYWPLDGVSATDSNLTPDVSGNGYDLTLNFMTEEDNFVEEDGRQAASFDGVDAILTRTHTGGDLLPISQHPAFTVAMWVKSEGAGQSDRRYFSEGSTFNNSPLFNLGTHSTGANGATNLYLRNMSNVSSVNHSNDVNVLDGNWHHVTLTYNEGNQQVAMYIDGVLDRDDISHISVATPYLNTTSVGGILREVAGNWFSGFIDDVALWSTVLQPEDILELASGTNPLNIGRSGGGLVVTEVVHDSEFDAVTLTWNSIPGKTYTVRFSSDLESDVASWTDVVDQLPSGGDTTSYTILSQTAPRAFYVVIED